MTNADAALALSIVSTVLAAGSATWSVAQYLLSGARPELTPMVGTELGTVLPVGTKSDVRPTLHQLETQTGADPADRIIGVTVVNRGRADLCITRWAFRTVSHGRWPLGTTRAARWIFRKPALGLLIFPPFEPGCPELPCTVPPGGEATLFTKLAHVRLSAAFAEAVTPNRPQRVVVTATSAGRTRTSRPFYVHNLAGDGP